MSGHFKVTVVRAPDENMFAEAWWELTRAGARSVVAIVPAVF